MLYFPVCSGLKADILPCRSLCESVKATCSDAWQTDVQCDILPVDGFCLDAGNCRAVMDDNTTVTGRTPSTITLSTPDEDSPHAMNTGSQTTESMTTTETVPDSQLSSK